MPVLAESEPARLPVGTLVADELLVVESDDTSMPALLPLLCADTSRTVERPTLPRAFGPRHSNTGSIQLIVRPLPASWRYRLAPVPIKCSFRTFCA
jgi:hypothetical protein